jgi:hypothetical protein
MAVVGMPLLAVTVLHASTVAVAAITASAYLPWMIIGLPGGAWVDRLPCRRLMITCDIMSFTFTLVCLLRHGPENSPSLKSLRSPWPPGR